MARDVAIVWIGCTPFGEFWGIFVGAGVAAIEDVGALMIASGPADIVVAAGVVSYMGIKLVVYNLQVTLGRAASWALQDL